MASLTFCIKKIAAKLKLSRFFFQRTLAHARILFTQSLFLAVAFSIHIFVVVLLLFCYPTKYNRLKSLTTQYFTWISMTMIAIQCCTLWHYMQQTTATSYHSRNLRGKYFHFLCVYFKVVGIKWLEILEHLYMYTTNTKQIHNIQYTPIFIRLSIAKSNTTFNNRISNSFLYSVAEQIANG